MTFHADGECGAPEGNARGIGNSVKPQARSFPETAQHAQRKAVFMGVNDAVSRAQQVPAQVRRTSQVFLRRPGATWLGTCVRDRLCPGAPSKFREVVDACF